MSRSNVMDQSVLTKATILIATDNQADAGMVRKHLQEEYANVFASTEASRIASDFEQRRPDVLVLAFDALEKSERYYLGLYRLCPTVHQQPHRTIILCSKDEVKRAYDQCRKRYFDDYVLFWPMTYDMQRLAMSVHHALRELAAERGPSVAEFAAQARRLAQLETLLDQQMASGDAYIDGASAALDQAERQVGAALDGFSRRMVDGSLCDAVSVANPQALGQEISRLKREDVLDRLRGVGTAVEPLKQWAKDLRQVYAPPMQSVRALTTMAEQVRPVVLIVDDDERQRRLLGNGLERAGYGVLLAVDGVDALNVLGKTRPDVILMDVMMPEVDGIETTRRIKASPQLAKLKIIMMTGRSEGQVVIDCLKAGATDFVVKPIDRDALLEKLARVVSG